MNDLVPDPKPLPLRIPPLGGESWPGYLTRVACEYGCREADLVRPISSRWARRLRQDRLTTTCSGVAMTDRVAKATARRMNLSTTEIQTMHLSSHEGVTVSFEGTSIESFDPVTGTPTRDAFARLGWLSFRGVQRRCRLCEQEGPKFVPLTWHYPWATMCRRHDEPLRRELHSEEWELWVDGLAPSDVNAMVNAQAKLEGIVSGKSAFRRHPSMDGFIELRVAAEVMVARRSRWDRPVTEGDEWFTKVMPDAVDAIETHPGTSSDALERLIGNGLESLRVLQALQLHGVNSPFGLRYELATRHAGHPAHTLAEPSTQIHVPASHFPLMADSMRVQAMDAIVDWGLHPDLVVPGLSDYTPWLPIEDSHHVADQTAYMMAGGLSLREACKHLGARHTQRDPLRRLWWYLESTGQFDSYLSDVRAALLDLVHERPWESEDVRIGDKPHFEGLHPA